MKQENLYEKALLSANDLCGYMNIGIATAYKLLNSEGFPTVQIGTRKLANKQLLDEWLRDKAKGE